MNKDIITKLTELKRRFDAGEINKEQLEKEKAIILGEKPNQQTIDVGKNVKEKTSKTKNIVSWCKKNKVIIATIFIFIIVAILAIVAICTVKKDSVKDKREIETEAFPNEEHVKNVLERYCRAIVENDFISLEQLYAPHVERFQDAYDKDRDYVIDCHKRYDKKFKVYGKYSTIRWDSFIMENLGNGRIGATIVEDYMIDREDDDKNSIFVLEKHFVLDSKYNVVSVYDNQLSRKKLDMSKEQLSMFSWYYVEREYANGENLLSVGSVYGKVDFRKNLYFRNLVRKVVSSASDFKTMMLSGVRTTEYMDFAMGKIGQFDIEGDNYSIELSNYMGDSYNLRVSVNGHVYEWESSEYASLPLENNWESNEESVDDDYTYKILALLIRAELGDMDAAFELLEMVGL